jgi:aminopeptidase
MSIARASTVAAILAVVSAAHAQTPSAAQDTSRYRDLARRVVQTSAAVKPGEVVYIIGGSHTIPFMEAIGTEVMRTGAVPVLTLESQSVIGAFIRDLPEQNLRSYDSLTTALASDQFKRADVIVMLPVLDNPDTLFATLRADTARMAKMMKTWSASQERYDAMRNNSRARLVYLNYPPTRTAIAGSGMDSASFDRMAWDAMTADYDRIAAAGQSIKRLLDSGKSVRVTTPDGTDLRFSLTGRSAAMTGATLTAEQRRAKLAAQRSITLPGGRVAVAPLESSGSGKVVVARDECLGAPLVNARFEVRAGKLAGFQADSGSACITSLLNSAPGPDDMLGMLSIGLNPAIKPVETGRGFRPWEASGAVVVAFGNNIDLGGKNNTPSGVPFWLSKATVEIDGKAVVKEGQLVTNVAQGR